MNKLVKAIATLVISVTGFSFIVLAGTPHRPLFLPQDAPYVWSFGTPEIVIQCLLLIAVIIVVVCIWRIPERENGV